MIGLLMLWVVVSSWFVIGRSVADSGRGHPFDDSKKGRIKTNLNAVALALNIYDYLRTVDYHKLLTPKTPIQKEIEAELKEIEQLEKQKEDMDKMKELKARKERLFAEVSPDYEESTGPHFKWCAVCMNYYSGERCDCLDKKVNAVDPLADGPYKLIYNGHEVPFRFRTEQEAHKYAKAISTSNWFIAEIERIDV